MNEICPLSIIITKQSKTSDIGDIGARMHVLEANNKSLYEYKHRSCLKGTDSEKLINIITKKTYSF